MEKTRTPQIGLLVLVMTLLMSTAARAQTPVLSGQVFGDGTPLSGVLLRLRGTNDQVTYEMLDWDISDSAAGAYDLAVTKLYAYYYIAPMEDDPCNCSFIKAETDGGKVIDLSPNPDWIEYESPLDGKVLNQNNFFYDCGGPVNQPPDAKNDAAVTDEDTPLTIDVLANDSDPDDDPLQVQSITQPAHGEAEIIEGSVRYTPDPDFYGADTFTYTINDGQGGTDTATVTITVNPVNDPPVANPDWATTPEDTPVYIDVLANDTDPDGDPLTIVNVTQPQYGFVETNPDGTITYTPTTDFPGTDTFSYTVSDGRGGYDTATVNIKISQCSCMGGECVTGLVVYDIGGPEPHGQITENPQPGDFTIKAAGADIWGPADQFSYAYTVNKFKGDFTADVSVEIHGQDIWAKAGIMARENLNPNSPHVMVIRSAGEGVHMQGRHGPGEESWTKTLGPHADGPVWLSLSRNGNTFTAAYKYAGASDWIDCVSTEIDLPDEVYIGLATTSHQQGTLATAVYSRFCEGPYAGPPVLEPHQWSLDVPHGGDGFWGIREVIDNGFIWSTRDAIKSLISGTGTIVHYTAPWINICDSGDCGDFGGDALFGVVQQGFKQHGFVDDLSLLARGTIWVEQAGTYTIDVLSDDGFQVCVKGEGATNPKIVYGDGEEVYYTNGVGMRFPGTRGADHTGGTVYLTEGCHDIELTYFERDGGAGVELSCALGEHNTFDPDTFRLLGDPTGPLQLVDPCSCEPLWTETTYELHASAGFEFDTQSGEKHTVRLDGPMRGTVHWEGPNEGDAQDDDGDGKDDIEHELESLELNGPGDFGPVEVDLDPARPSFGELEEAVNNTEGTFELPPFVAGGTGTGVLILNAQLDVGDSTCRLNDIRLSAELTGLFSPCDRYVSDGPVGSFEYDGETVVINKFWLAFPGCGACCLPDGTCQVLSHAECLEQGGVPQLLETDCNQVDCKGFGEEIKINFQPENAGIRAGYLPDYGYAYGDRGNGFSYGWNQDITAHARDRDVVEDQRYDTLNHMMRPGNPNAVWYIDLPNGTYDVFVVCGDPSYRDSTNNILIGNRLCIDEDPWPGGATEGSDFDEFPVDVEVRDGRLTIQPGDNAFNAKICWLEIRAEPIEPPDEAPTISSLESFISDGRLHIRADVSDDTGVDRVEFYHVGDARTLIGTIYPAPGARGEPVLCEYDVDPSAIGVTIDEFHGEGQVIEVMAIGEGGLRGTERVPIDPEYELMDVTVEILEPCTGCPPRGYTDYLYTDNGALPAGTIVEITAKAAEYEWGEPEGPVGIPGPPGEDGDPRIGRIEPRAVPSVAFYVNGHRLEPACSADDEDCFRSIDGGFLYTYPWDASGLGPGDYEIEARAVGTDGTVAVAHCTVTVRSGTPNIITDRDVSRIGNYFTVTFTIYNNGTATAEIDKITDEVCGFQVVTGDDAHYSVTTEYVVRTKSCYTEIDLFAGPSHTFPLPPGESVTAEYSLVPILFTDETEYSMGGEATVVDYYDRPGTLHHWRGSRPCLWVEADGEEEWYLDSFDNACRASDYLIMTHPNRHCSRCPAADVQALLVSMAELAVQKTGTLGYLRFFGGFDHSDVKALIQPGGAWSSKLATDWIVAGYLLIVGETEIVPARDIFDGSIADATSAWSPPVNPVPYVDNWYADIIGNDNLPELIVGRVIGDTARRMATQIETALTGLFDRSDALVFSGIHGEDSEVFGSVGDLGQRFVDSADEIADLLNDEFATVLRHGRDYASDTQRLGQFRLHAQDKDVIVFRDHGNPDCWSSVVCTWDRPFAFGASSPIAFALACLTGDYEDTGDDGYSIAEAFLDSGAGVYIGATERSATGANDQAGRSFFDRFVGGSASVGQVLKATKWDLLAASPFGDAGGYSDKIRRMWALQYNLYGDPKYGASPTVAAAFVAKAASGQPPSSLDVTIPDYEVTNRGDLDDVQIPGGQSSLEPDMPMVPIYIASANYPKRCEVQDVVLTDRSGLTTETGLNLRIATVEPGGDGDRVSDTAAASPGPGWYPEDDCHWRVVEHPDGTTTLIIIIYPFYYNAATTDVKFYKNYSFDIDYIHSSVEIVALATDKDSYPQGDDVQVNLWLYNSGEAQDVTVNAVVRAEASGELVDGLLLRTLKDLKGMASFSPQWGSSGFEPGHYYVEVTLNDTDGNVLDRKTAMFRLGICSGEITNLTATPEYAAAGDDVRIDMTFSNTGTVNITGTAVIRILNSLGELVEEYRHDVADLIPSDSISFSDIWNVPEFASFTVVGQVLYDGKATDPVTVGINKCACVDGEHATYLEGVDINGSLPAGTVTADTGFGDYTITAGGADIWGTADQFYYAYHANEADGTPILVSGDFTAIVGFKTMEPYTTGHDWAKIGIMARADVSPGSPHATIFRSLRMGAASQGRDSAGHESWHVPMDVDYGRNDPVWVRLDRVGDTFTSCCAVGVETPPTVWTSLRSREVPLPPAVMLGLAASSLMQGVPITATCTDFCIGPYVGPPAMAEPELPDGLAGGDGYMGVREVINNDEIRSQDACYVSLGSGGGTIVDYMASALNIQDSGGNGNFAGDDVFGVVTAGHRTYGTVEDLSLMARGIVRIPAGQGGEYTFGVNSDDSFTLQLPGHNFVSAVNGEVVNFGNGAALRFFGDRAAADTLGVINLPAGHHEFWLTYHEGWGGAAVELYAAKGSHAAFAAGVFHLVGGPGGLELVAPAFECLPDCHADYLEWVAVGKPACWCYQRQCHGDADGVSGGSTKSGVYYVGPADLNVVVSSWLLKEPPHGAGISSVPNGICADFAHDAGGSTKSGLYRVGPTDLNILITNWLKKEPPHGPGIHPDCLNCP
ncbi:MAG: tandem-95 repeat protein [Phycisphaerales bacterium]|nr:MAG: tandem-95 repeat protein [Phycisphaerales bacterium]